MSEFTLVTGASGGIGRAIALSLAKEGHALFLHYHRSRENIMQLKHECEAYGSQAVIVQSDLTSRNGAACLLEQLHFPVGHVVYNCGTPSYGLYQDLSEKEFYELAHIHFLNAMWLTHELLPSMLTNKKGTIVMISSIWGEKGAALEVAYSAMKGGVNTFVKALAKETARSGVRVNAVAPGVVDTPMMNGFTEEEKAELAGEVPAGRFGVPEDVAEAVVFLMRESSSYINGHILNVNGGW
ncbi:elongation factor P 5-aminopentanone reductase [Salibacterium aidingense]|uniref:elongation factor P 5-aminopentanone reductase n=1 Tax=Salibacterium aidingense TaxID=384933 RepID=UPI003BC2D741